MSCSSCVGCGELFLGHTLHLHQRSCARVSGVKKTVKFVERPLPTPQDPYSSDVPEAAAPTVREETSIEFADNGTNSFLPCDKCGRRFFPDRLPVHIRACKGRPTKGSAASRTAPLDDTLAKRLQQIDELLASGLVSQDEYDAKRAALLG